jgi:PAS domain-containing protein
LSIEYERDFREFEKKLNYAALLHSQLWSSLIEDSPDYHKVKITEFKILELLHKIERMWNKLQSIASNVSKTLKFYANFHLYVLNDKKNYETLTNRSNDYMIVRNFASNFKGFGQSSEEKCNLDSEERCNFAGDGSPCMIISGNVESFEHVVDYNLAVCREFGYKKGEFIGKSVETIFPSVIAKYEMHLLRSYYKEEAGESLVYGLHKNGYIFPMFFRIVETPSLLNESNFIALIYVDKVSIALQHGHILLDKYCKIVGISSN